MDNEPGMTSERDQTYLTRILRAESVTGQARWRVKPGATIKIAGARYRPGELYSGEVTNDIKDQLEAV